MASSNSSGWDGGGHRSRFITKLQWSMEVVQGASIYVDISGVVEYGAECPVSGWIDIGNGCRLMVMVVCCLQVRFGTGDVERWCHDSTCGKTRGCLLRSLGVVVNLRSSHMGCFIFACMGYLLPGVGFKVGVFKAEQIQKITATDPKNSKTDQKSNFFR